MKRRTFITASGAALIGGASTASGEPQSTSDEIMHHVRELCRIMRRVAPEGVEVSGLQFRAIDGELAPDTIWASARGDDLSHWHMKPAKFEGWTRHSDGYHRISGHH